MSIQSSGSEQTLFPGCPAVRETPRLSGESLAVSLCIRGHRSMLRCLL